MATIEKRGNQFRVVFWFRGERFSRSLRTTNEREALSRLARLDDNLRRFELGLLTPPDDADLTTFLLSDGRSVARPSLRGIRTLDQLLNAYFKAIPVDSIEPLTISGMEIHAAHLRRLLGAKLQIQSLELVDLQGYVSERAKDPGIRGRRVSPATIRKDVVTLRTVSIREKKRVRSATSRRRTPLSPALIECLQAWLRRHPGGQFLLSQSAEVSRSKTARSGPTPVTADEAHDFFRRTLAGSRWQSLRGWHVFRHSFCSNCAARCVDQRLINAWVGHQTEEMVNRYRHQIPSLEQQALARVFD